MNDSTLPLLCDPETHDVLIACFYDPAETLHCWLFRKPDLHTEYLKELAVGANARVLEVSVGPSAAPEALADSQKTHLSLCRLRMAAANITAIIT